MTSASSDAPMLDQPRVALESTVIAHGLPYPQNLETALALEQIVREEGAAPCTIGIIGGEIRTQLSREEIELLARSEQVAKVSLRDLPVVTARRQHGATTVAATMWIARRHGIDVFATGGIGGVHRGEGPPGTGSTDASADLEELGRNPVTVVCAGAKAILDLPATLEYLETRGVTVIGYETDEFPAFYSRSSGLPVHVRSDDLSEIAGIIRERRRLGLAGGVLVCAPVPEGEEIPRAELEPLISEAMAAARGAGIRSADVTPFLLSFLHEHTAGRSLRANIALLKQNARLAARLARAL